MANLQKSRKSELTQHWASVNISRRILLTAVVIKLRPLYFNLDECQHLLLWTKDSKSGKRPTILCQIHKSNLSIPAYCWLQHSLIRFSFWSRLKHTVVYSLARKLASKSSLKRNDLDDCSMLIHFSQLYNSDFFFLAELSK